MNMQKRERGEVDGWKLYLVKRCSRVHSGYKPSLVNALPHLRNFINFMFKPSFFLPAKHTFHDGSVFAQTHWRWWIKEIEARRDHRIIWLLKLWKKKERDREETLIFQSPSNKIGCFCTSFKYIYTHKHICEQGSLGATFFYGEFKKKRHHYRMHVWQDNDYDRHKEKNTTLEHVSGWNSFRWGRMFPNNNNHRDHDRPPPYQIEPKRNRNKRNQRLRWLRK